jgi:hypothetical protein
MQAICLKCIDNIILATIDDHILAGHINASDVPGFERCGISNVIPSVGIGCRRSSNIFLLEVILVLDQEVRRGKAPIV